MEENVEKKALLSSENVEKKTLFSSETLEKIQRTRKLFLKIAVWVLIAALALGALLILSNSWGLVAGKLSATFMILALILFVSVNNFIRLEKGDRTVQIFALIGFMGSLLCTILSCLLIWEILPSYWTERVASPYSTSTFAFSYTYYHMTIWMIAMLISAYAAAGGFCVSNVMSIKETTKLVKPLKITSIICAIYLWVFGTIMASIETRILTGMDKLYQLSALAALAFGITALAALVVSRTNKEKADKTAGVNNGQFVPKTDDELRAEIEEQVRREMIEKEVRAKLEAEQNAGTKIETEQNAGAITEAEQNNTMPSADLGTDAMTNVPNNNDSPPVDGTNPAA